jgi:chemotaxis protein histidine kinase CheA
MATLREFFATEAADYLAQLTAAVQELDTGGGDAGELHRHTRALRGSAQMAREERVYHAALGLEAAARSVANGLLNWSEDISTRVRRTLEDIEALIKGGETEESADGRLKRALERWKEAGVEMPAEQPAPTPVSEASRQFQQFAAHEVSGIVNEMEAGLATLATDPRNRDPLKSILRRQRALLGAARLEEISVVAEALRATEDMTRVIAKLNVPVKEEWLAVFRSARDVLKAAIEPLQRSEAPPPTPALSKLRTLRQELLDRYGEGEAVAVTGAPTAAATAASAGTYTPPVSASTPSGAAKPAPVAATPKPVRDEDGIVPIDALLYEGPRALQRALELQPALERIAGEDPRAREQVRELFDLIRMATA